MSLGKCSLGCSLGSLGRTARSGVIWSCARAAMTFEAFLQGIKSHENRFVATKKMNINTDIMKTQTCVES